jgi:SNF2 family DNA or RNA helicase
MIISPRHKTLVLKLKDPNRVTSIIPGAKLLHHKGNKYVVVKHGLDEVKVLSNIGIDAPSPILHYYKWSGRFDPFSAQKEAAAFMTMHPRAFNLSDMGTGKTLATLWAYDYLRSIGQAKKMLVISPLSTLERTWADEIFNHFPHLTVAVLHGSTEKRLKLLKTDADIYLINHDGIKVKGFVEAMKGRTDIDLVIIDEISQMARNAGTDRYLSLHKILKSDPPRAAWGLTGTPVPNAPTDAWAQCKLLVPEKVPPFFNRFKANVMKQVSNFVWVPRPNAMDMVYEAMQPAIRFTRDECVDLPECTYITRHAKLTDEQEKAYKEMLNKLKLEHIDGNITAVNEAVKAQKLIQIACGVVYGADGIKLDLDATPRLELVKEVCEEAGTKVIVFVPFVSVIEKVADYLKSKGFTTAVIHGGVPKSERDEIFRSFQKAEDPKILVAQPATMSHGLTLTAASTMVWYAPISSSDTYLQACARITRPGQKQNQLIVNIEGTPIEQKYYKRLADKEKTQGILLDLIQESR